MQIKFVVAVLLSVLTVGMLRVGPRAQQITPTRSVWDGVYSKEQAKRGREIYAQACAKCHGDDLAGADEIPALSGGAFLANWDGLTMGDLSERVRISMPPNNKGKLTKQQIVDVLSHVLSANDFPAGDAELDPKVETLKQIRIDSARPKNRPGAN